MPPLTLRSKVLHALGWAAGAKLFTQLINWSMTLYVIRLLTPNDYGLMAIAMTFISLLLSLSEFGLGAAIVQRETLDEILLRKTTGFVILVSLGAVTLLVLISPIIAAFFARPELTALIRVLSISLLLTTLGVAPGALLTRRLDFKWLSLAETVASIIGGAAAVILAVNGFGVWALVWANLISAATRTIGVILASRSLPRPDFDLRGTHDVISYGTWITLERFTWMLSVQADVLLIGKLLGPHLLGYFSIAKELAQLPMAKVQGIINNVAFPAYSEVRKDPEKPRYYLMKYLRIISLISFPVFFGLSAVAPEFIQLFLSEKWSQAILPMQLLTLALPFRMVDAAMAPFLQALGHVRTSFQNVLIGLVMLVAAILVGVPWALPGVSVAWATGYFLVAVTIVWRSCRIVALPFGNVARVMAKGAVLGALMYIAVLGVRILIPDNVALALTLSALILAGVTVYTVLAITFCRTELRETLELVQIKLPFLG